MKTKKLYYFALFIASALICMNSCKNATDPIDTNVSEPLRITGFSFENSLLTCKDNSFYIYFNKPINTTQTDKGPIITIDSITSVTDPTNNDQILSYFQINSTLQLENGNIVLKVTIDNNFNDNTLYYLNIKLSRITGNEDDDNGFSFHSSSVAKIIINEGPESDLKPIGDKIRYYKPGRILILDIPNKNNNYVFKRWICVENASIFADSGISDTLSNIMLPLTCQNTRLYLNFYPLYDKK